MKLNEIRDNEGSKKSPMRVGRGIGSGKGKTAGVGHKGQKARKGVAIYGFEGGQMPLYRRLPKRGFNNISGQSFAELNLTRLQKAIDDKQLDATKPITAAELKSSGVLTHVRDGVRLLGTGTLSAKVQLTLAGATASAIKAVEKAGGKVTLIEVKEFINPKVAAKRAKEAK